ncbi:hypothetical protein EW146_g2894 [Bondarzewia mesenterica]|uniref:DUF6534 domain-containing protein n=1 Tax=Bondarzewia mesenterica TaxID=1095465 RepID=A0A4S4M1J6_9AGAM|nr:hypothetical protein EW146_g2894 [Bondarzewia mesenterica]
MASSGAVPSLDATSVPFLFLPLYINEGTSLAWEPPSLERSSRQCYTESPVYKLGITGTLTIQTLGISRAWFWLYGYATLYISYSSRTRVEVLFNGLIAFLVQSFLTYRIYHLSRKNVYLTGFVIVLIAAQFSVTLVYFGKSIRMETYVQLATLKGLSMAVNATTAASDVVIALSLVSMLHFSRTGFKRSDSIINKLILYTVNTGLLTSIDAVCSLATIAALPNTFIYICFFFALGRLYANSLLATLNARKSILGSSKGESMSLSGLQSIPRGISVNGLKRTNAQQTHTGNIAIQIDTTREYATDREGNAPHEWIHKLPSNQLETESGGGDTKRDDQSL